MSFLAILWLGMTVLRSDRSAVIPSHEVARNLVVITVITKKERTPVGILSLN